MNPNILKQLPVNQHTTNGKKNACNSTSYYAIHPARTPVCEMSTVRIERNQLICI
jgi:hypothetical protein